jgi:hypothetical protein
MSTTTQSTLRAGTVAIAPAILLAALSSHPYLPGQQPNVEALAAEVAANPTRWGLVHVATGVASGLLILAFLSVRSYLQKAGEDRWSALGLPFVIIGSTLYAMLPAMEFAPLAAVETGGNVQAAQAALLPWFAPLLLIGAVSFGIGVLAFAVGIARSRVLGPGATRLVSVALVVMAASRFVPWSAIQFYVQGAAGVIALLPLAAEMWRRPEPRPANPSAAREWLSRDAASAGR